MPAFAFAAATHDGKVILVVKLSGAASKFKIALPKIEWLEFGGQPACYANALLPVFITAGTLDAAVDVSDVTTIRLKASWLEKIFKGIIKIEDENGEADALDLSRE